jgi:alkylation response protein AidB-like acyl-CoA dehydrogenase
MLMQEDLVAAARRIAGEISPTAAQRDADRLLPYEAFQLVRQARIGAARVPRHLGGVELGYRRIAEAFIALARGDSNVAQALIPHFTTVERIVLMGVEAQRKRYLGLVQDGYLFAGATSERGGTFRTDIATRLTRSAAGYRLNGRKFYSTGSLMADGFRVTAIDESGEQISVLLPKDRPGITLLDDWDGMGQRTTASGTTEFLDVAVEPDEIIPFVTWHGLQRSYATGGTQLLHAAIEVGIALAALDDAIAWARSRARPVKESGVARSVDDPFVQHTIGNMSAHAHAAEAIVLRGGDAVDFAAAGPEHGIAGEALERLVIDASVAVAEAKIISTEAALRAGELLYEVGGASATLRQYGMDRHWRNARTHTTHDPVSYKFKVVGEYLLTGTPPPVSLYY